jgi:hypothetical protein
MVLFLREGTAVKTGVGGTRTDKLISVGIKNILSMQNSLEVTSLSLVGISSLCWVNMFLMIKTRHLGN